MGCKGSQVRILSPRPIRTISYGTLTVGKFPDAIKQLRALSEITRVPQSAYLREALDDLLKKYAGTLRKAGK
jgi:hypothetical protein